MPRLWTETIETHRTEVRDSILDATAELAAENGPAKVTMTQVAERTGIGRATLYKYFDDIQAIFVAWHEKQIAGHFALLEAAKDKSASDPRERLEAVLKTYAFLAFEHHGKELVALLARGPHAAKANEAFVAMLRGLIEDGVDQRLFRADVPPAELASFCIDALGGASSLPSRAAVRRLVAVAMAGLRVERLVVSK